MVSGIIGSRFIVSILIEARASLTLRDVQNIIGFKERCGESEQENKAINSCRAYDALDVTKPGVNFVLFILQSR